MAAITRGQFARVLDEIADTRGPVRQIACSERVADPVEVARQTHRLRVAVGPGGRRAASIAERARERTLTDDELRAVWLAAETGQGPFGSLRPVPVVDGNAAHEAAGLKRSELSPTARSGPSPARYKNRKDM